MTRGLWVGVCLFLVGCQTTSHYTPPPERIPSPLDVNGVQVLIEDRRPDWERQPFTGPVSLYHLGKVNPNAWERLARETEAVVAALPEKPAAVVVTVVSFRLVKKEDGPPPAKRKPVEAAVGYKTVDDWNTENFPSKLNYERARMATENRDQKAAGEALGEMAGQPPGKSGAPALGVGLNPWAAHDERPQEFAGHPEGASCSLHAVVQVVFPGGREQVVTVKAIAAGQNTSGTAYWGEALDVAVKMAVLQFGRQFRQGVGLPVE